MGGLQLTIQDLNGTMILPMVRTDYGYEIGGKKSFCQKDILNPNFSTRFDEGTYRAIATNEHGQATSKGCVKIDDGGLKKPIEALGLAPSISARLTDVRVLEGEPLKLVSLLFN